jgi:hypothetical protein
MGITLRLPYLTPKMLKMKLLCTWHHTMLTYIGKAQGFLVITVWKETPNWWG